MKLGRQQSDQIQPWTSQSYRSRQHAVLSLCACSCRKPLSPSCANLTLRSSVHCSDTHTLQQVFTSCIVLHTSRFSSHTSSHSSMKPFLLTGNANSQFIDRASNKYVKRFVPSLFHRNTCSRRRLDEWNHQEFTYFNKFWNYALRNNSGAFASIWPS
jgi:hypothetical protein